MATRKTQAWGKMAGIGAVALAVLGACTPTLPESGYSGSSYSDYMRQQQTAEGQTYPLPQAQNGGFSTERIGAVLDQRGAAPSGGGVPQHGSVAAPIATGPMTAGPVGGAVSGQVIGGGVGGAPLSAIPPAVTGIQSGAAVAPAAPSRGISDEQNFDAVASRETIESDAERIARNRSQYQVVAPTALPERQGARPNIVQYALSTQHNPGTKMHSRNTLFQRDSTAACHRFTAPDLAQEEFLAQGGPARDKLGLDPDGDGFACGWDPRPFRKAAGR